MTNKRKIIKRISIIIISILLAFSFISMIATKVIYDSIFVRYDSDVSPSQKLSEMLSDRQTFDYEGEENLLRGYLYESAEENKKDALIILAPGFHAGADDYLWQIKSLCDYGWSVFAFDSTGSCESQGESAVGFPQILLDMDATLKYIENNDRFGYNDIVLLGHSRGGYAVCCALKYDYDISAVVSVSGVNSAMEGIMGSSTQYVGNFAYANYGFLWLYQSMLFGTDTANVSADEEINQSDVPVLIVHGNNDEDVPIDRFSIISHSDEINSETVEYYICRDKNHNGHTDLLFDDDGSANDKLMEEINNFLTKNTDN